MTLSLCWLETFSGVVCSVNMLYGKEQLSVKVLAVLSTVRDVCPIWWKGSYSGFKELGIFLKADTSQNYEWYPKAKLQTQK